MAHESSPPPPTPRTALAAYRRGGRALTIRDVAARAAVSHQTVSRVLNDHRSVATATRQRVLDAIEQLGYVPNPLARGLIANRTRSVGMVTADVSDSFFARAVAGAEAETRQHGYYLIVASVDQSAEVEAGYLRLMLERRVEGLILARPGVVLSAEQLEGAEASGIPLVAIGTAEMPGFVVVDVDNAAGGYLATRHLIDHGHRRIATIVGPPEWPSSTQRHLGYLQALRDAGLEAIDGLVERADDWGLAAGEEALGRLTARREQFTALFAHSDLIAMGAIRLLRGMGRDVPADVSVVGYDDLPIAEFLDPPLTTVHQPMREVGQLAAAIVHEQLEAAAPAQAGPRLLPASLVPRQSVAAPPSNARQPRRSSGSRHL